MSGITTDGSKFSGLVQEFHSYFVKMLLLKALRCLFIDSISVCYRAPHGLLLLLLLKMSQYLDIFQRLRKVVILFSISN